MENMKDRVGSLLRKYEFDFDEKKVDLFTAFIELLLEENKKYNIASIKDTGEFLEKTFIDSLMPLKIYNDLRGRLIDIGSGNGFPGAVLGIAQENLDIVLCDAEIKKIRFLEKVCDLLGERFKVLYGRAEDNPGHFGKYDYVTAKALVSKPDKWLKWTIPYMNKNGLSMNYKTSKFAEEIELAGISSYLKKKKCGLEKTFRYSVHGVERELYFFRKLST